MNEIVRWTRSRSRQQSRSRRTPAPDDPSAQAAPWGARLLGLGALLALSRRARPRRVALRAATPRGCGHLGAAGRFRAEARTSPRSRRATSTMLVTLAGHDLGLHRRRTSSPAPAAISTSAMSISATASRQGQLLAQITAPELDHQIAQAEATLQQTEATLAPEPGQHGARECHLAARQAAGRERLGDAATGRSGPAWAPRIPAAG